MFQSKVAVKVSTVHLSGGGWALGAGSPLAPRRRPGVSYSAGFARIKNRRIWQTAIGL